MTEAHHIRIKIASVSLSQIVYDYATNVRNIKQAIDLAVADHADILATEELSIVGYPADDYHQWNKDNDTVWTILNYIARYAEKKNPNLVLTVGVPWHYADKSKHASDAKYNINDRPYNTHAVITGGRVVALSAKSILADGPAEYETRQFNSWPLSLDTIRITLPDGSEVPFGKVILHFGDRHEHISLVNEICAEGWPGVYDDQSINHREQAEARHIAALAQDHDLSVVLNPSASKPQPAINKEKIRIEGLCKTGSRYCGVYVYTNYLGSASGTYAAEGSQIFAQNEQIIHHGRRYSFRDVSYSSAVVDVPTAQHEKPTAVIAHTFIAHVPFRMGREAAFDAAYANRKINAEQLSYEEYMRSIALWLRDYLAKPTWGAQGYVVSLSGGKDSAYGALAVTTMIDLDIQENGIANFLRRFNNLKFGDEILTIEAEQGIEAAKMVLKNRLLTCVYLPTDNSSTRTLNAARFLIEGGTLPDGTQVKGIGGKFYVAPVQAMLDEATVAFTGLDLNKVAQENLSEILDSTYDALPDDERLALARAKLMRTINDYVDATPDHVPALPDYITRHCVNRLPTWANPHDDLTLQNIQARIRLPVPWTIAGQERKMPLVTSNESEAVHSYTTAGGDMHMGGANPIGGIPKHAITQSLAYFEQRGLVGLAPVRSLYWINHEEPSAELRKMVKDTAEQTDESDLGFTYAQSQFIEERLIVERQTPLEVLPSMRQNGFFPDDPAAQRDILIRFAQRWESGQFKRIMGALAPHVGSNVDPHQSVRTTVIGDHFHTGCAHMTLEVIKEILGGDKYFEKKFSMTTSEAKTAASINADFKSALISWSMPKLLDPNNWLEFQEVNKALLSHAGNIRLNEKIMRTQFSAPGVH